MDLFSNFGWFGKSIISMFCFLPLLLLFNVFNKMGVKPEAIVFGWGMGIIFGILLTATGVGVVRVENLTLSNLTPTLLMLVLVFLGGIFGTTANILWGQAMILAPNPALPFAIGGMASVIGYMITPLANKLYPKYFDPVSFCWVNLLGIIMLVIAIALVMYKPSS